MGLDMYLYDKNHNDLGYWRKANHIHKWFVDNVQNGVDECHPYQVSRKNLEDLLNICSKVLADSKLVPGKVVDYYQFKNGKEVPHYIDGLVINDPSTAKELLPVFRGFFFGSYDYDDYYYKAIAKTIKIITEILESFDFDNNTLYYQSSW